MLLVFLLLSLVFLLINKKNEIIERRKKTWGVFFHRGHFYERVPLSLIEDWSWKDLVSQLIPSQK